MTLHVVDRQPLVKFYCVTPGCPKPRRALNSGAGTLPARALQYCRPARIAAGLGWHIFPPINFSVMWNGSDILWTYDGGPGWMVMQPAHQFPGFSAEFDVHAPPTLLHHAPPFVGASKEPGFLQIWSGVFARTIPGWALLNRGLPNVPASKYYEHLEGIVEADTWFGPLFTNLRLTETGLPITFKTDFPLFHVQPIQRIAYDEDTLRHWTAVEGLETLSSSDWENYAQSIAPAGNTGSKRRRSKSA